MAFGTDPVGNDTTWDYDDLDCLTKETNELLDERTFEYDAIGHATKLTDRNERVTEYDYDNLHRLTEERWKDGATTIYTANFNYDAASQLTSATDDFSDYDYTYNDLGRVTLIEIDNGGPLVKLNQEYDASGHRTKLAAEVDTGSGYGNDFENTYTYDNLYRLTKIEQTDVTSGNAVADKRVDFEYNAAGQFTKITRYDDLAGGSSNEVAITDYSYDDIGRLTDLTHTADTTAIADYDWTFDAFSRVTQMSFTSLVGDNGTSDYTYDDTRQITDADHDFQTDEDYSYDENGNRTTTGYTTGGNNQLTSDGTFDYEYDDEGNRTKRSRISTDPADDYTIDYVWDHRNRLTKITYKDKDSNITKDIEYTYDVFGRRIEKSIDWDGPGPGSGTPEETQYIYDGLRSDRDNAGDQIALAFDGDDSLINRYLYGPNIDQILADEQFDPTTAGEMPTADGDILWMLADSLGSVRDIVEHDSTNGTTVANHITYDAYGAVTSETDDTIEHIFGYTGRDRDEESNLQYNRARYYDPTVGRWISEDPIGFAAGDTNLVRYVGNGPTNATDPSGLAEADDRETPNTIPLVNVDKQLEDHINKIIRNARRRASYPRQFVMLVFDKLVGLLRHFGYYGMNGKM